MCLHFAAVLVIYVLPKFIRGSSTDRSSPTIAKASVDESNKSNCMESAIAQSNSPSVTKNDEPMTVLADQTVTKPNSDSDEMCNDVSKTNHQRNIDTNFLLKNSVLKDLINKEVSKIKDETDNFSNLLMEKIEAANIEGLIDKTVSGIVELKDDLMRMNEPEVYSGNATEGLRKRNVEDASSATSDMFLKKEIDAIKEANVIPAVLSNGHAK